MRRVGAPPGMKKGRGRSTLKVTSDGDRVGSDAASSQRSRIPASWSTPDWCPPSAFCAAGEPAQEISEPLRGCRRIPLHRACLHGASQSLRGERRRDGQHRRERLRLGQRRAPGRGPPAGDPHSQPFPGHAVTDAEPAADSSAVLVRGPSGPYPATLGRTVTRRFLGQPRTTAVTHGVCPCPWTLSAEVAAAVVGTPGSGIRPDPRFRTMRPSPMLASVPWAPYKPIGASLCPTRGWPRQRQPATGRARPTG